MDVNVKFGYWIKVAPFAGFKLGDYARPYNVGKRVVPSDFNGLTIGQLMELSTLPAEDSSIYEMCRLILGMERREVDKARAVDVVKFCGWAKGELERITKLFSNVRSKPTELEKKAGIDKLKFGMFGLLDWYALRMGMTDHDSVLAVPWLRVYKCMEMDNLRAQYKRNYNKVMNDEYRRKNKGYRK